MPQKRTTPLACIQCGQTFYTTKESAKRGARFCSKTCAGLSIRTRVECKCRICGTQFTEVPARIADGRGIYCSRDCAQIGYIRRAERTGHRRVARTCQRCGAEFFALPSIVAQGGGKYCSYACRSNRVECTCHVCGTQFTKMKSKTEGTARHYCSQVCQFADRGGSGNPAYKGGEKECVCKHCGRRFFMGGKMIRKGRGHFCSRECANAAHIGLHRGERSPLWRGGGPWYYGPNWITQRKAARERDGYRCQECGRGSELLKRVVSVHHIIPFRFFGLERHQEANLLSNLVCLCGSCHQKREHRDYPAA